MSWPGPDTTSRFVLRPGTPVVRRTDTHLQVGIEPGHCVVIPDRPEVQSLVEALRLGLPLPLPDEHVHRLKDAGLLIDVTLSAAHRLSRSRSMVALDAPADEVAAVLLAMEGAGVHAHAADAGLASDDDADLLVLVRAGEVERHVLDAAVRSGLPHVLMTSGPDSVTVGPFVDPGRTACLRCLDAHHTARDPRWPVLVEQAARQPDLPRDPTLFALAVAWLAGDVAAYLEGRTPSTWSATIRIDLDRRVDHHEWSRHPHCGCAWALLTG